MQQVNYTSPLVSQPTTSTANIQSYGTFPPDTVVNVSHIAIDKSNNQQSSKNLPTYWSLYPASRIAPPPFTTNDSEKYIQSDIFVDTSEFNPSQAPSQTEIYSNSEVEDTHNSSSVECSCNKMYAFQASFILLSIIGLFIFISYKLKIVHINYD